MTLNTALGFIYSNVQGIPVVSVIGAYGVAIIVLTILIRLLLAPLQQFQLVTQRKTLVEQRKLAPQVAELRKKYKKDPQRLNTEMMKMYQEHGVNPLGGLIGCLPLVVQLPILTALYYVFTGFARTHAVATHFLFVPNLNDNPNHHLMFAGLPIIASDVGDVRLALADGEAGLLVHPGSPEALAEALDCVLRNPGEASALGKRAASRAAAEYGISRMVASYAAAYGDLVAHR